MLGFFKGYFLDSRFADPQNLRLGISHQYGGMGRNDKLGLLINQPMRGISMSFQVEIPRPPSALNPKLNAMASIKVDIPAPFSPTIKVTSG